MSRTISIAIPISEGIRVWAYRWVWRSSSAIVAVMTLIQTATAQDLAAAAAAFERGQRAQLAGDHSRAARYFEIADAAAPSVEALRSAMQERRLAADHALAASHALSLLRRYPSDTAARQRAEQVLAELTPKLLRVRARCPEVRCTLALDGAVVASRAEHDHDFFVEPGKHDVVASIDGAQLPARNVEGAAGEERELSFSPAPVAQEPVATSSTVEGLGVDETVALESVPVDTQREAWGLHPLFFWNGVVLTAIVGGLSIWSGVDTLLSHDDYLALQATGAPMDVIEAAYQSGLRMELRTNVLFAVTAAFGVATAVLTFLTRWGNEGASADAGRTAGAEDEPAGDTPSAASAVIRPGLTVATHGALLTVERRF